MIKKKYPAITPEKNMMKKLSQKYKSRIFTLQKHHHASSSITVVEFLQTTYTSSNA